MDLKYLLIEELGRGEFGTVFKAQSTLTGTYFALKVAKPKGRTMLTKEAQIHSRMVHPNILQFVSSFESQAYNQIDGIVPLNSEALGNCSVMVMELCTGNTLDTLIKNSVVTIGQISTYGREIASGLFYLKEQGVIHRDIKPENILLCNGVAKIADFGLSDYYENLMVRAGTIAGQIGTPFFMPLEAFSNIYDYSSDVFAFGVLLYLMYARRYPWAAKAKSQLLAMLRTQKPNFDNLKRDVKDRDAGFEELMLRMLHVNASKRPPIKEVLSHPFFAEQELNTTVMVEDEDEFGNDIDDAPMSLDEFIKHKTEFGNGTRDQFYLYLANLHAFMTPMSMQIFTRMWDKAMSN